MGSLESKVLTGYQDGAEVTLWFYGVEENNEFSFTLFDERVIDIWLSKGVTWRTAKRADVNITDGFSVINENGRVVHGWRMKSVRYFDSGAHEGKVQLRIVKEEM